MRRFIVLFSMAMGILGAACAFAADPSPEKPDLSKQPTLYVVGYAHLDTEWRWEYPQTIGEFLPNTMHRNFDLFEKYPHYIFNFSGANRYRMMKEYYPADYQRLKHYVDSGRWFPAGSSMEEGDVNSPSAEAIIREILYGNDYFRREFGKASEEYMLPDCFGFPASLPSILAHAGVKGFSTQKLTWGSSAPAGGPNSPEETPEGTPFNVGVWVGPDGHSVIAALNPGSYGGSIREDLSKSPTPEELAHANPRNPIVDWPKRVELDGKVSGVFADYHYYGTGDVGGSPNEASVRLLEAIVTKGMGVIPPPQQPFAFGRRDQELPAGPLVKVGDGPLHVISATADQMFRDITPAERAGLPTYKGELELTNHSAGSLTSEAYQKRWNRKNELLADAAERASVAADWMGGRRYPLERLNNAWTLVMGGHFHDLAAGTATPRAYEFSQNDEVIAMNQFAGVLTSATEAIASALNTDGKGTPIVVYNPLNIEREDIVEANIKFAGGAPKGVRVTGPDGKEVPAQVDHNGKVVFLAKAPSVGYAVYNVEPAATAAPAGDLKAMMMAMGAVQMYTLENARYRVAVSTAGDVTSIFDKSLGREMLSAPARLAFETEHPHDWPAWNMDWADQQKPPRGYVDGPAKIRFVENGPARIALEVQRESEGSKFTQTIRLAAGDAGNRVEFGNVIDWKSKEAALKAVFPLTASNPTATYNLGVGTIERPNDNEKTFEMDSHQWFDLTDHTGAFGATILSDCKYGSDKPSDNTLRLTLIYTPGLGDGNGRNYSDQTTQDWGHHEFVYGFASHTGDWRQGQSDWQALRLNEPLIAFETVPHRGALGKEFSLLKISNPSIRVMALKKAERGDEVILRMVDTDGKPQQDVRVTLAGPIAAAREVNGQEQPVGPATLSDGSLVTSFTAYQPRTFALKLGAAPARLSLPRSREIPLTFDRTVATRDGATSSGGFDAAGDALPAEMLPSTIDFNGVTFTLASSNGPDALVAKGQTLRMPPGRHNRIYVLAAAVDGDQKASFRLGNERYETTIEDWGGFIGQWDTRKWNEKEEPIEFRPRPGMPTPPPNRPRRMRKVLEFTGTIEPGFIKRSDVAWYCSHHHTADGKNTPYSYSYLFAVPINVPVNAWTLTLPDNDKIRILAVSAVDEQQEVRPVQPLYDTLGRSEPALERASR